MSENAEAGKSILAAINDPADIRDLSIAELKRLAEEIRQTIITTVSKNGGHLAPSLGVVELTLGLLKSFDPGRDRLVWDVGHQAYAYKLLTGRRDRFDTLRTMDGVSGFPRPKESPEYDHFGVGHSSTSISAALGMAVARDLAKEDYRVAAIIGDGSMTAGLAYEGLNQAGGMGRDMVVVLNDNEMSISSNVGALSSFLSRSFSKPLMVRLKKEVDHMLRRIPRVGDDLAHYARRSEDSVKSIFTPGMLFMSFGFNYLGPIDGHDLDDLVEIFDQVKKLEGPVLVHVITKKGKGYEPAERNPTYFHGVGCFEPETGNALKFGDCSLPSYTEVFGQTLCKLARSDEKIVAITAAMPEGTGLRGFAEEFPERFVDVGICEQHAVTFAAGLAKQNFKPVVAIYSTFMQRSYDQIVHDVCLQNLPVVFCMDRGGLVGEDGATHHGAFDLSFMRHIPNITVMVPADEAELRDMMAAALSMDGPVALRYPRGVGVGVGFEGEPNPVPTSEGVMIREVDKPDVMIVAVGSRVHPSREAAEELAEEGLSVGVFNARFVKPLPAKQLLELADTCPNWVLAEENARQGGFGSAVLELLAEHDKDVHVRLLGLPDAFVEHGKQRDLRAKIGLDKAGIKDLVRKLKS